MGDLEKRMSAGPFRLGRAFLVSVLLTIGVPPAGAAPRVVEVGVYENAPKVFIDESGRPAGIFVDLIQHIAENEGWDLRYVPGTWGEGLDRLKAGTIDLMPDVAYSAEREKVFAFHREPVLSDWFQVYARKDAGIESIVDLAGKRIVVLEHSVQQEAFEQLVDGFGLSMDLTLLPDYQSIFERVARRDADAAVTNRFYGVMHARRMGLEDTAIIFNPTRLFFAAPREGRARILAAIDGHMARMKQDPESIYYGSLKRWTSEKVPRHLPDWIKAAGLAVGIALILSLAGAIVLRRQVNARTRELQQINREMEARIQERTAELAAAMEKARESDRLKSVFLATMSHELRTPLNSIIGFTGILLQGLAGTLNPEQQKQMRMVQRSARHLLSLINDVLDISKIEAGELSLSHTDFELGPSIERVVRLISPMAEQKGLDLEVEIADGVASVTSDQRRLEQVMLNLLNNAVKFTEQGGIRISCRTDGDHCLVSVADTGIGIREEEMAGLFQPFHQVDTSLVRKREGTGLGLSISRKLMVMMGGAIEVQSRWGRGSSFTLRFPIQGGDS